MDDPSRSAPAPSAASLAAARSRSPRVDLVEPGQGAVVTLLCRRAQVPRRHSGQGRAHGLLGLGDSAAAPQVLLDRLLPGTLPALGQVTDGGGRGRNFHPARVRQLKARQYAQQGRLPNAVRPHDAHALARAQGQRNTAQHHLARTVPAQVRGFEDSAGRPRPGAGKHRDGNAAGDRRVHSPASSASKAASWAALRTPKSW